MNKHVSFTLIIFSSILLLSLSVFGSVGTWHSVGLEGDDGCSQNFHVMCGANGSLYNPANNSIPYSNNDETSDFYCVITDVLSSSVRFGFINGSLYNISSYEDLRNNHEVLLVEQNNPMTYDGGYPAHYDENCNGYEMFERNEHDQLNLTKYVENNVTYDVIYSDSNIDDFDILAKDEDGELLNLGTLLSGRFIDESSDLPIEGVNATLYFRNNKGTTKPYLSFISDETGFFTTAVPRNITSSEETYSDVFKIPLAEYILITSHPKYEDSVTNIDLTNGASPDETFYLTPYGVCQSDCTFEGSSICRAECQGINSCNFGDVGGNWSVVAQAMDGRPLGSQVIFTFESNTYKAPACTGTPVVDNTITSASSEDTSCTGDSTSWRTSEIVVIDGQVVRMVVNNCQ